MTQLRLTGLKDAYILMQRLGTPGLYGQAFLARRESDGTEVVIKERREGAPADGTQVLAREAQTLMRVAEAEAQRGCRFTVRLLDRDPNGTFIVMEYAVGQNFKDDLLEQVAVWNYSPTREAEHLPIMLEFARALQCVHEAGLTCTDMKLGNLFWDSERHQLHITDWNIVRDISNVAGAVSIDWARFGARLYEVYTGESLEVDADGNLLSQHPAGQRWEDLPAGVQMLIERALARGYEDDAQMIADLERERAGLALMQQGQWETLLLQAEAAETGRQQLQAVLSLAGRAEKVLTEFPPESENVAAIEQLYALRERLSRRSRNPAEKQLNELFGMLRSGNFATSVLKGLFLDVYERTGQRAARARRGAWLCDVAYEQPDFWQQKSSDLLDTVIGPADLQSAVRLNRWAEQCGSPTLHHLAVEAELEVARAAGENERALVLLTQLPTDKAADLAVLQQMIEHEHRVSQQRRERAAAAEQHRQLADQAIAAAELAERSGDVRAAVNAYHRALNALDQTVGADAQRRLLLRQVEALEARQTLRELVQHPMSQVESTQLLAALPVLAPELKLDEWLRSALQQAKRGEAIGGLTAEVERIREQIAKPPASLTTQLSEVQQQLSSLRKRSDELVSDSALSAELAKVTALLTAQSNRIETFTSSSEAVAERQGQQFAEQLKPVDARLTEIGRHSSTLRVLNWSILVLLFLLMLAVGAAAFFSPLLRTSGLSEAPTVSPAVDDGTATDAELSVGPTVTHLERIAMDQREAWTDYPADPILAVVSPDGRFIAHAYECSFGRCQVTVWDAADGSLLTALQNESSQVTSLAFSPDTQLLAVGAEDGSVTIWSVAGEQMVMILPEVSASVSSMAFSSDGTILAVGASDGVISFGQVPDGGILRSISTGTAVTSLTFSGDNWLLAAGLADATVRLWRTSDDELLQTLSVSDSRAIGDVIRSVAISPTGDRLAAGMRSGSIVVWQTADGKLDYALTAHDAAVTALTFSPDGALLLSGSADHTGQLRRTVDGTLSAVTGRHGGPITAVQFAADGGQVMTASVDSTLQRWQLEEPATAVSFVDTPAEVLDAASIERMTLQQSIEIGDGRAVAFSSDGLVLTPGQQAGSVQLRQMSDASVLQEWHNAPKWLEDMLFTRPEESLELSSGARFVTARFMIEAYSGLGLWRGPDGSEMIWNISEYNVGQCCSKFSPDSQYLATGVGGTIAVYQTKDGILVQSQGGDVPAEDSITALNFSPDGQLIAAVTSTGSVRIWRRSDDEVIVAWETEQEGITELVFSSDGRLLATAGSEGVVSLWSSADGSLQQTLSGHTAPVTTLAFSPDGRLLASGSDDQTVRLWLTADGTELRTLDDHTAAITRLAFSPDGLTLGTAARDFTLKLYRAGGHRSIPVEQVTSAQPVAAEVITAANADRLTASYQTDAEAISADSQLLVAHAQYQVLMRRVSDGRVVDAARNLPGGIKGIQGVVLSADGRLLAVNQALDGLIVRQVSDGSSVLAVGEEVSSTGLSRLSGWVDSLALSPDGQMIAVAIESCIFPVDIPARRINGEICRVKAIEHMTFSPDGQLLAAVDAGVIRLWRVSDDRLLQTLSVDGTVFTQLAFSPDGQLLAGVAEDGVARIWRIEDGTLLHSLVHTAGLNAVAFSPDGQLLAVAADNGTVSLWQPTDGSLLHILRGPGDTDKHALFSPDGRMLIANGWLWRVTEADGGR